MSDARHDQPCAVLEMHLEEDRTNRQLLVESIRTLRIDLSKVVNSVTLIEEKLSDHEHRQEEFRQEQTKHQTDMAMVIEAYQQGRGMAKLLGWMGGILAALLAMPSALMALLDFVHTLKGGK